MPDAPVFRPRGGRWRPKPSRVAGVGFTALLALGALSQTEGRLPGSLRAPAVRPPSHDVAARAAIAEATMRRGSEVLRRAKTAEGVPPSGDRTGLIGQEVTPLVTTLGSLEAKRLSTNPAWARVLTERLAFEGIGRGSIVAASLSGSFPGLNLALASACQALDARLLAISSVTASTWGANEPGFSWPEMEVRLVEAGPLRPVSIAVTAGGAADRATDLAEEDRAVAERIRDSVAARLGIPALVPAHFDEAVRLRTRAYLRASGGSPIVLYVNVGGAEASMGRSPAILGIGTGFVRRPWSGGRSGRGVTAWFADRRVPILMLLNVRELAVRWGIGP
jgi:poly-gamma-glutamate system protein